MKKKWEDTRKRPTWMPLPLWEKWLEHWSKPENASKSQIAKNNHCGGQGGTAGATHGGGCVSFEQHLHNEKHRRPGNDVHMLAEIIKYHGKKSRNGSLQRDDNGDPIFVNKRHKNVIDQYKADIQLESEEGETAEQEVIVDANSVPFQGDKWVVSSGGVKKGRVLGIGSTKTLLVETGCSSSNVLSRSTPYICPEAQRMIDEAQNAAEVSKRASEESQRTNDEMRRSNDEMRARLEGMDRLMNSMFAFRNNPSPH